MPRLLTFLLKGILLTTTLWLAGLAWFASEIPSETPDSTTQTDAIVVLTGGDGRLEKGFELFRAGKATSMLISGVGEKVSLGDLIASRLSAPSGLSTQQLSQIYLGREADSTETNARETQEWMHTHRYASLRLVTANYHMPRSMLEFSALMPGFTIVPEPVEPEHFHRSEWWAHDASRRLMLSEYHKYVATWLRIRRDRL